ncbi:MAG: hypothetical protein PUD85_03910 [Bacteroidales bacterium]|nr:hypothetical protein [Bacteroidales bacterium]
MKHELNEIIAGMNSRLSDDESFMSELEARMDFVDRVKERNERLASKARKMVLRSILLGLLGAALILLGAPGAFTDLLEGHEASLWGVPGASLRGGTEASLRGEREAEALFEESGAESGLQGGRGTSLRGGHEASLQGGREASLQGGREAEALFEESGAESGLQGGLEESLRGGREESLRTLSTDYSYRTSTYSVLSAILAACLYCLATLAFSLSFRFE